MVMCVLLAFMVILWGRVLLKGKSSPASAAAQEASDAQQLLRAAQSESQVDIKEIALPELAGRNDTLSHDMFRTENWAAFGLAESNDTQKGAAQVGAAGDSTQMAHQTRLEKIAQRLVLEAVIQDDQGRPWKAFVEDKILSVGSTLTVKEGPDQYVLTLDEISENQVSFSWNKLSVVLEMAETFEF
jgi:hypothetical protein